MLCPLVFFLPVLYVFKHKRRAEGEHHHQQNHAGDRLGDEVRPAAAGNDQRAAHVLFHGAAQQQAQNQRTGREPVHLEEEAQRAHGQHEDDVGEAVVDAVGAHDAQHGNRRPDGRLGDVQDLRRDLRRQKANDQERDVRQHHQDHDLRGKDRIGGEHGGARGQAVHGQGAQQNRGDGVARQAEGQHGGHRAADNAVVGRGGNREALAGALAVQVAFLTHLLGVAPADDGGNVAAGCRNRADKGISP